MSTIIEKGRFRPTCADVSLLSAGTNSPPAGGDAAWWGGSCEAPPDPYSFELASVAVKAIDVLLQ
eukprot:8815819-Pyramimonas_sp.AAC.2